MAAFALVTVASMVWFGTGWHYGVEYQGYRYTLATALISLGFAAIAGGMLMRWRTESLSLPFSLTINFLLFAWVFTYAFPYLGELP